MIDEIDDSDDMQLLMEFRQMYGESWKQFLVNKRLYTAWLRYVKNQYESDD